MHNGADFRFKTRVDPSELTLCFPLCIGSPGSPVEMSITMTGSMLDIHWTPGETGGGHVIGYVIEARPSGTSAKIFALCIQFEIQGVVHCYGRNLLQTRCKINIFSTLRRFIFKIIVCTSQVIVSLTT